MMTKLQKLHQIIVSSIRNNYDKEVTKEMFASISTIWRYILSTILYFFSKLRSNSSIMFKPFLQKVAEAAYQQYNSAISDQTFIFPNRRAGIFFQNYLAEIAQKPIFSPKIITINEIFRSFTQYQVLDRISLLFTLYRQYQQLASQDETFDEFVFWGEMILNDFDDIDKYLADARQLFTNIKDLKEIESEFSGLTEEQIASVREFWYHFEPTKQGKTKDEFLTTWNILYPLYSSFRAELIKKQTVYEGMIFREVAESILQKKGLPLTETTYIFVGLNALTRAEEILLEYLKEKNAAQFYWDIESPKSIDKDNRSSLFIQRYIQQFPSPITFENDATENPNIEVIGVSSATGQAKQTHSILQKWINEGYIDDTSKAINTAIVLPDETLLMPTLYSIPEEISTINVTMGYPLKSSPIAGLMEHIFALQSNWRIIQKEPAFYFKFLLPVINHRYINNINDEFSSRIYRETISQNRVYVNVDTFVDEQYFNEIFQPIMEDDNISEYLLYVLDIIELHISEENSDERKSSLSQLEKEFIYQYYTTVNRLNEVITNARMEMSNDTYFRLLRKLIAGVSIPFQGEPLAGLQVMGVLETRALDFENLIILSMNEGIFPLKGSTNSFIPYNLRKGFGLSTYEYQESVYAYHFYRMIHRAKNITFLYDTRSEGLQTGEVSRYVHQLKYHYRVPLTEKLITFDVSMANNLEISIQKNERIMEQLNRYFEGGDKSLSASSLNCYLDCSLKFYFQEIEKMSEEEEVTEEIEGSHFGSIFHYVMEKIYEPYKGNIVSEEVLKMIKSNHKNIEHFIEEGFALKVFNTTKSVNLLGQNLLIAKIIKRYVMQVLNIDQSITPFVYFESEEKVSDNISLLNGQKIRIKGSIDRVDEVKNQRRIIDYKTGNVSLTFSDIEKMFDTTQNKRPKEIMQVFLYAYLYGRKHQITNITPAIYGLRNTFSDFEPRIQCKNQSTNYGYVDNYFEFHTEFENHLKSVIDEIFEPNHSFTQTKHADHCTYCNFSEICRKN